LLAEFAQGHDSFGVVEQLASVGYILRLSGNLGWLATQAGAITRSLGFIGARKELH
jgi:hypothetical protein